LLKKRLEKHTGSKDQILSPSLTLVGAKKQLIERMEAAARKAGMEALPSRDA
jgi:hypothetical protein